jgi:hypothetical protein
MLVILQSSLKLLYSLNIEWTKANAHLKVARVSGRQWPEFHAVRDRSG